MLKLNLWQSSPPGKIRKAPAPALSLGVDVRHLIFEGGEYGDYDVDDHDGDDNDGDDHDGDDHDDDDNSCNDDRDVVMYVTTNCRSPPTISLVWSLK